MPNTALLPAPAQETCSWRSTRALIIMVTVYVCVATTVLTHIPCRAPCKQHTVTGRHVCCNHQQHLARTPKCPTVTANMHNTPTTNNKCTGLQVLLGHMLPPWKAQLHACQA